MWHLKAEGDYNFLYHCFCFEFSVPSIKRNFIKSDKVTGELNNKIWTFAYKPDARNLQHKNFPWEFWQQSEAGKHLSHLYKSKTIFPQTKTNQKSTWGATWQQDKWRGWPFCLSDEQLGSYITADPCDFNHQKIISVLLYKSTLTGRFAGGSKSTCSSLSEKMFLLSTY